MNMNVSKTNTGKLLAAVLVLAMVFAGAAVLFSEESNAAPTNTQQYSGTVDGVQTLNNNVVINDRLTVTTNGVLIVAGNLTVNQGVTVTIQNGGQLIVQGELVTINGTVTVTGNGTNANFDFSKSEPTQTTVADEAITDNNKGPSAIRVAGTASAPEFKESGIVVNGNVTVTRGATFDVTGSGSGYILVNNGGTVAVTKVGSSVATIDRVHVALAVGGNFEYSGRTVKGANVTVSTYGTGAVYTTGQAVISSQVESDVTLKSTSTTSNLTFTNVNRTFTGYYWDSAKTDVATQSIREYALEVSGTVANFDKIAISGDVSDSKTYFNTEDAAKQYNGVTTDKVYYYNDKVMGTAQIPGTLTIANTAAFEIANSAFVRVSGILNFNETDAQDLTDAVSAGTPPIGIKLISISGIMEVSGTVKANGNNINGSLFGTIAINGGNVEIADFYEGYKGTLGFYGAYYVNETDDIAYFSDLSAAITGASAAEISEVSVWGTYLSNEQPDGYGSYIVSSDITIPEGISLTIGSGLIIAEGTTMTVSDGVYINFDIGEIFVDGKLIDQSLEFEVYETTNMSFEVKSVSEDQLTNTYTSLAIALRETTSGTIYLYSDVEIDGTMTINENVTVQYADDSDLAATNTSAGITFADEDAELVINGTLYIAGKHTLSTKVTDDSSKNGTITVNNVIRYDGTTGQIVGNIAGAYFTAAIGDLDTLSYITSVAYAAENSASVNDTITINGNLSVGDVTFTQGDNADNGLKVEVKAYDTTRDVLTAGTITLVGDVNFVMTNMFTGTIQSEVTAGTSAIQFNKVSGAQIDFAVDNTGEADVTTMVLADATVATRIIDGAVTISTGTVYIGVVGDVEVTKVNDLTVASGATLVVSEDATLQAEIWGYDLKKIPGQLPVFTEESIAGAVCITVDGTLTVEKGATFNADLAQINGTLNNNGAIDFIGAQVAGTINFAEDDDNASIDILIVSGAVSGEYETVYTVALTGADMANAVVNPDSYQETGAESTTYYINGVEFATVYAGEIKGVGGMTEVPIEAILLFADVNGVRNDTAKLYSDEAENNVIFEMTEEINNNIEKVINGIKNGTTTTVTGLIAALSDVIGDLSSDVVGDYDSVYITMEPADVSGSITVYSGMNLYIDGQAIENFWNQDLGKYVLSVGEHKFSVQITPGYTGTPVVTINGQAVTDTFTISQDAKTFQIVVTGDISYDTGSTGGDDGMGLTEILLVILVILIVVMAIMVALRLMRS